MPTLTACYAKWGVGVKNPRRAWSAEGHDGTIVVTLWSHEMNAERTQYSNFKPPGHIYKDSWPKRHRTARLVKVGSTSSRTFYSIIATAGKPNKFEVGARMRLTELNRSTGEFRAERDDQMPKPIGEKDSMEAVGQASR